MTIIGAQWSSADLLGRFDELEEGARDRPLSPSFSMPPVEVPPGGWPDEQPEGLPPGHWAPDGFGDEEDAQTYVEDEGTVAFAIVYPGSDGYWYVYYIDNTDLL